MNNILSLNMGIKAKLLLLLAGHRHHPMKETLRYLAGIAGPSGYGSNSTAEQVIQDYACSDPLHLTAIITGATSGIGVETARALAKKEILFWFSRSWTPPQHPHKQCWHILSEIGVLRRQN
ncbi:RETINOL DEHYDROGENASE [Salix purpurea]|uniref:RETINOL DEHYDROGENASE n=1 Tax=Salix purpurea TaxID=77065 RepID=A0A9Q0VGW3_SALPP|nr:RETINOL DEHYDROGENASE [Salix purpurea]